MHSAARRVRLRSLNCWWSLPSSQFWRQCCFRPWPRPNRKRKPSNVFQICVNGGSRLEFMPETQPISCQGMGRTLAEHMHLMEFLRTLQPARQLIPTHGLMFCRRPLRITRCHIIMPTHKPLAARALLNINKICLFRVTGWAKYGRVLPSKPSERIIICFFQEDNMAFSAMSWILI